MPVVKLVRYQLITLLFEAQHLDASLDIKAKRSQKHTGRGDITFRRD